MEQAKQSQSRNKKGRAKTKVVADLGASSPTPTPEEDDVNARDDVCSAYRTRCRRLLEMMPLERSRQRR